MKGECPGDNVDPLCKTIDSSDLLTGLPVVDENEGVVYRNVFCARCNSVVNTSYWQLVADCGRIPSSVLPTDNAKLTSFIRENCSINYTPTVRQQPHIKRCLAAQSNCSSNERLNAQPILEELCSFYALPVCGNPYKNPHCALCNGDDITKYDCGCRPLTGSSTNPYIPTTLPLTTPPATHDPTVSPRLLLPPPPLSILFNFGSNQISIQGKTTEVNHKTCKEGFVYDPFVNRCRETLRKVSFPSYNSSINSTNSTVAVIMLNCSLFIRLNSSFTVLYPNGTLWVPLYETLYNQTNFFVNGSYVFVCTNFSSNYSATEALWSFVMSPLHILTYAGCSVSFLSLLILVVVYGIFKELRTLPGKNLINLSIAMIFYHIFLFVAGSRNIHRLCIIIAVLLHYFLLSSFAWMSVMAFDVAKTFVFRGKKHCLFFLVN